MLNPLHFRSFTVFRYLVSVCERQRQRSECQSAVETRERHEKYAVLYSLRAEILHRYFAPFKPTVRKRKDCCFLRTYFCEDLRLEENLRKYRDFK